MKKYITPVTEFFDTEQSFLICASIKGEREHEISDNSGNNQYQNPEWYQYDDSDDDDGELNSQSKDWGDLWGDLGF